MENAPHDVRHIMQGSLARVEHVWARIPEAQVRLLCAVLAVTLVGCWIRGGFGLAPTKGVFYTNALRLYGWAPHLTGID